MRTYKPTDEVDFVIVGSGAAGGVMARELSRNGYSVVVLEQGPWLNERDFNHDEFTFLTQDRADGLGDVDSGESGRGNLI